SASMAESDPGFGAGQQAADVALVANEHEGAGQDAEQGDDPLGGAPRVVVEDQAEDEEQHGGDERGQRHVAGGGDDGDPGGEGEQGDQRDEHGDNAGPRGHPLAAAEAEVDRKEVPDEGGDAGQDGQAVVGQFAVGRLRQEPGDEDRAGALGEVEQEDEDAPA